MVTNAIFIGVQQLKEEVCEQHRAVMQYLEGWFTRYIALY